jgi:ribosomal protein S18 acetylase RimI-like enzyme
MLDIRPVLMTEYPAFYALMHQNMQRYHERYDLAWDQQWTESNYRDKHNYAICRQGEAVGFLSLEWQPGQLYIHTLQLDRAVQGGVYGARVFAWLKALAVERGAATIVCKSFKDNPALAMYRKMGLEIVETQGILVQLAVAVDRVWLPGASK